MNPSAEELIKEGEKFLENNYSGPPKYNKWRDKVLSLLQEDGSDFSNLHRRIPKARKALNRYSGRGLKSSELKNVNFLIGCLEKFESCDPISKVPQADLTDMDSAWNSDRLNTYLKKIDERILSGNYEGAITLCYSCSEGFLKAFYEELCGPLDQPLEIVAAGKKVQKELRIRSAGFPDEVYKMVNHICYTLDRVRNRHSESHFDGQASEWLAVFMRDLTNSLIRALLVNMRDS